jgi:ABC-type cobalamin/Fe3+-siderophores transport system ATPase subunit
MLLTQLFQQDIDELVQQASAGAPADNVIVNRQIARHLTLLLDVWRRPQPNFPILYLHGPAGSGKTTLLQFLGNSLSQTQSVTLQALPGTEREVQQWTEAQTRLHADAPIVLLVSGADTLSNDARTENASDALIARILAAINQHAGFSANSLALAALERALQSKGLLEAFQRGFQARTGLSWAQAREGDRVLREDILKSISAAAQNMRAEADLLLQQSAASLRDLPACAAAAISALGTAQQRVVILLDQIATSSGTDIDALLETLQRISAACAGKVLLCAAGRSAFAAQEPLAQARVLGCALRASDVYEILRARELQWNPIAGVQLAMFQPGVTHPISPEVMDWLDTLASAQPQQDIRAAFLQTLSACRDSDALALLTPAHFWPHWSNLLAPATRQQVNAAIIEREGVQAALLSTLALAPLTGSAAVSDSDLALLCQLKVRDPVVPTQSLAALEAAGWIRRAQPGYTLNLPESEQRQVNMDAVSLSAREKMRVLAGLVFDDILQGQDALGHSNLRHYGFNRLLDAHAHGSANHELTLMLVSPLAGDYVDFDAFRAVLRSAEGGGQALLRMAPINELHAQLNALDRGDAATQNERRAALLHHIKQSILRGDLYVAGKPVKLQSADAAQLLEFALTQLIHSVYPQVDLLAHPQNDVLAMIRVVLGGRELPAFENADAQPLVRDYLDQRAGQLVSLNDVVQRFRRRPYGWPDLEVVLLVARWVNAKVITARIDGHTARPAEAAEAFTNAALWSKVMLVRMLPGVTDAMLRSSELAQRIFGGQFPLDSASDLSARIRAELEQWRIELSTLAAGEPGVNVHDAREALSELRRLGVLREAGEFLDQFNELGDVLADIGADLNALRDSRKQTGPSFARMRKLFVEIQANLTALARDPHAAQDIEKLRALQTSAPRADAAQTIEALCESVSRRNFELIASARELALEKISEALSLVHETLAKFERNAALEERALRGLHALRERVEMEYSHASLLGLLEETRQERDSALDALNRHITAERPAIASKAQLLTVLRLSHLSGDTVLEREEDLDVFFDHVRAAVTPLLLAGMRVRLE